MVELREAWADASPQADDDESLFDNVAGDVVVLVETYFDESYDPKLLCVAGYSFTSRNARLLDGEWRKMLLRYKRLPYFRMSICNASANIRPAPFDRLNDQECVAIATEAIGLINKYASVGYAVTIDQKAFYKRVTKKGLVSTPYEFCSWLCLSAARSEMHKIVPFLTGMSFFFEAGFENQSEANRMMNRIFKDPGLRQFYKYKEHRFVVKSASRPTQAADLIAWQWYKDMIRRANGATKPRGDLAALTTGTQHYMVHATDERLQEFVEQINARAGTPIGNEIAGIALKNPDSTLFPKRLGELGSREEYEELKRQYPERFKT